MTEQQPQLFTIPAITLTQVVNYLGDRPFKEVVQLMMMIEQTVKPQEQNSATVQRSKRQRKRSEPKPTR